MKMKNILVIHTSVRYGESISRALTDILVQQLKGTTSDINYRDLSKGIPLLSGQLLNAVSKTPEERSAEESQLAEISDRLIKELEWSDFVVIGLPMYNFGPPANLKAWADLVARAGTTFRYSEDGPVGLLKDKKAYIIAVSGGTAINSEIDFMTPWLQHFLKFIGINDISTIVADGIFTDNGSEKIQIANNLIQDMITEVP